MKYLEVTEDKHRDSINTLNKHAENGGESIIALTAPWCGHCKALKPELEKMRKKIGGGEGLVANVSDKYHGELIHDTNVQGYPSIFHYKGKDKHGEYEGKREANELANYVNSKLQNKIQQGGRRVKKKTIKRKKYGRGQTGSRPANKGPARNKTGAFTVGGVEIHKNSASNDVDYIQTFNEIYRRLLDYHRQGLGGAENQNDNSWGLDNSNTSSVKRGIDEMVRDKKLRPLILDVATLVSEYDVELSDEEVLALSMTLYFGLVAGEQTDDTTDVKAMLGKLAYDNPRSSKRNKLYKIYMNIGIGSVSGKAAIPLTSYEKSQTKLESEIRRKLFGLNNMRGGKKRRRTKRKRKTKKKRHTKKRRRKRGKK